MIKKIIIIMLMVLTVASSFAQTLEEYLTVAAENNPKLKASFNQYLAALEEVPQVGSLPDPEVTFGYFARPMETLMGNQRAELSLMQMFPWFGMLKTQKDEAAHMANAQFQLFQEAKNQLFFEVKGTWYELYRLNEEIRLMEENLEILRSFERLALTRFRSGGLGEEAPTNRRMNSNERMNQGGQNKNNGMEGMGNPPSTPQNNNSQSESMGNMNNTSMSSGGGMVDVLRAQMEIKELENKISALNDAKKPLIAEFNRLLNRSAGEEVLVTDTLTTQALPMDQVALLDSMMLNHPMIKMYNSEIKAYEAQKEMARKEGYPMIGAGLNYMIFSPMESGEQMEMGGKNMFMPMVSVTIPLNRKKIKAMKKEADLMKDAAQYEQANVQNELSVQWEQVLKDLADSERRINLYQEQKVLANQAMRLITTSYSANNTDFEEVLRVQQQLIDYRLSLINAIVDQNKNVAKVEMLAAIHIN